MGRLAPAYLRTAAHPLLLVDPASLLDHATSLELDVFALGVLVTDHKHQFLLRGEL